MCSEFTSIGLRICTTGVVAAYAHTDTLIMARRNRTLFTTAPPLFGRHLDAEKEIKGLSLPWLIRTLVRADDAADLTRGGLLWRCFPDGGVRGSITATAQHIQIL